jgi:hypothetical protein
MSKKKHEELDEESLRTIHESVQESVRQMSAENAREQERLEKEVYRNDLNQERVEKSDRYVNQRRSRRKTPLY